MLLVHAASDVCIVWWVPGKCNRTCLASVSRRASPYVRKKYLTSRSTRVAADGCIIYLVSVETLPTAGEEVVLLYAYVGYPKSGSPDPRIRIVRTPPATQ